MGLLFIFHSVALVLWAVAMLPVLYHQKRYGTLVLSGLMMFLIENYLSWDLRAYPMNVMASLVVITMATVLGLANYYYELWKNRRRNNEAADE